MLRRPALDATDEMLDKMVAINIKAALRPIRLTGPEMHERGGKRALATMCVGVGQGVSLALERI